MLCYSVVLPWFTAIITILAFNFSANLFSADSKECQIYNNVETLDILFELTANGTLGKKDAVFFDVDDTLITPRDELCKVNSKGFPRCKEFYTLVLNKKKFVQCLSRAFLSKRDILVDQRSS
jgi:hypothetical protein